MGDVLERDFEASWKKAIRERQAAQGDYTPVAQPFVSESYDRLMQEQANLRRQTVETGVTTVLDVAITSGPALRAGREALGLSQVGLAERLGVNAPLISNMETGKVAIDARTDLAMRCLLALSL